MGGEVLNLVTGEEQFEVLLPDPERRGVMLPPGETRRCGRELLAAPTALGRHLETHALVDENAALDEGHLGEGTLVAPENGVDNYRAFSRKPAEGIATRAVGFRAGYVGSGAQALESGSSATGYRLPPTDYPRPRHRRTAQHVADHADDGPISGRLPARGADGGENGIGARGCENHARYPAQCQDDGCRGRLKPDFVDVGQRESNPVLSLKWRRDGKPPQGVGGR